MPYSEIKKTLAELQDELKKTPKDTEHIEKLVSDTHNEIEQKDPDALHGFLQTLREETAELEIEHPQITALISQITTALSGLGI